MKQNIITIFILFSLVSAANAIDFTLNLATSEAVISHEAVLQTKNAPKTGSISVAPLIEGIIIKGNSMVPMGKILDLVMSRIGDGLSQDKVKDDLKAIYSTGYFSDVSVQFEKSSPIKSGAGKEGTIIIYKVKENPILRDIQISGNTVYSTDKILSLLSSKKGQIMSYKAIQDDIGAINEKYHKDGYVLARVIDVSTDPKTAIVKIAIIEGMIESVILEGNTGTKDYVILRELNSKAGTIFNENTLGKDLKRVFNLGFFSDVTPNFEPGSSPDKVALFIKVKESKTNTMNFGGGYGEREGWFGFIDLSANNLFGIGHSALVRGQAGQQQTTYQLRYVYPWFWSEKLGERVSFSFRRWLTQGKNIYLLETAEREGIYNGWEIGFSRPISDEWSASLTIGSEKVNPMGTTTFEPYLANTIGLSLSYDTRDNWMNPSSGQFYTFGIRRGWKIASTDTNFTKNYADLNQFIKIVERQTLAWHFGLGVGIGDVPVGEVFYAGGSNTIRGYEPSQAKIGTRRMIANLEYRYTFNDMFQGVVFFDWGNAWSLGWPDTYDFISGKGFGLRLNTPMGPIRLDYGIASNRSFSEGVLHFSIGQAF